MESVEELKVRNNLGEMGKLKVKYGLAWEIKWGRS